MSDAAICSLLRTCEFGGDLQQKKASRNTSYRALSNLYIFVPHHMIDDENRCKRGHHPIMHNLHDDLPVKKEC